MDFLVLWYYHWSEPIYSPRFSPAPGITYHDYEGDFDEDYNEEDEDKYDPFTDGSGGLSAAERNW